MEHQEVKTKEQEQNNSHLVCFQLVHIPLLKCVILIELSLESSFECDVTIFVDKTMWSCFDFEEDRILFGM